MEKFDFSAQHFTLLKSAEMKTKENNEFQDVGYMCLFGSGSMFELQYVAEQDDIDTDLPGYRLVGLTTDYTPIRTQSLILHFRMKGQNLSKACITGPQIVSMLSYLTVWGIGSRFKKKVNDYI